MVSEQKWGKGYEIAGRYRLVERIGKGGMGEVWQALHLTLNSPLAIKLIDTRVATAKNAVGRFMQEARAAAALRSRHVVHTTDFGVFDGTPYIAMELLHGESLAQRLKREKTLSPQQTARVIRHVARAIQKAHDAGIIHRDLKPDNVFIVTDEDEDLVKVVDFGVAKAVGGNFGSGELGTRTGALLGTPYYMSPEQAQGDKTVDHRSDLWSIAVIAFECMVGKHPFDAEGLGTLVLKICTGPIPKPSEFVSVPPGFDDWFEKAVARDPERRFQTARELSAALRAVLTPEDADANAEQLWTVGGQPDVSAPFSSAPPAASSPLASAPMATALRQEQTVPEPRPHRDSLDLEADSLALTTGQTAASELAAPRRGGRAGLLLAAAALLSIAFIAGIAAFGLMKLWNRDAGVAAASAAAPSASTAEAAVKTTPASESTAAATTTQKEPKSTGTGEPGGTQPPAKPKTPATATGKAKAPTASPFKPIRPAAKPISKPISKPAAPPGTETSPPPKASGRLGF